MRSYLSELETLVKNAKTPSGRGVDNLKHWSIGDASRIFNLTTELNTRIKNIREEAETMDTTKNEIFVELLRCKLISTKLRHEFIME